MKDYMHASRGNSGPFGRTDAVQERPAPKTKKPWTREKREGRALDRAGKLVHQTARKDLESTNGVDKDRNPAFHKV